MNTITIKNIKEYINNQEFDYLGDFLNDYFFFNLKDNKEFIKEELEELLNEDYLQDKIFEFSEWVLSIYNVDLLEWLKDNYYIFEDYINEMWINQKWFDLMQNIRWAWAFDVHNVLVKELQEFAGEFDLELEI